MSSTHIYVQDRVPYTYLIGWSHINKWYYGVRYAKNCHPDDLWQSYFTSSNHIKKFIQENGNPDVVTVRKTFKTVESARKWETTVLTRLNAAFSDKWINKTNNTSIPPELAGHSRGKTYEEMYGSERAAELKKARSIANSQRSLDSWETRSAGKPHKNKGRKITDAAIIQRHSTASLALWMNPDFRVMMAQKKNTHYVLINQCEVCGRYKPANKKFCSIKCSNRSRIKDPV